MTRRPVSFMRPNIPFASTPRRRSDQLRGRELRLQCGPMNDTRWLTRERGLFAGALVIGAAAVGLGAPVDFVLFGLMLAGIALFHDHPLQVALTGLAVIVAYKLVVTGFDTGPGLPGLALHIGHEWVTLANF